MRALVLAIGEQLPQIGGERLWLPVQLAPGDADDGEAGGGERAVACAVAFEGLGGAVEGVGVEFEDYPPLGPEAVDFERAAADEDVGVYGGAGKAVSAYE